MSESTHSNCASVGEASKAAPAVLSEAERHKILEESNRTKRDYPKDKCIHQLFEELVWRTPESVAVECGGKSLTYRELNAQSGVWAEHLRAQGVGPEVMVGLYLERSLEWAVALLAVFKAGGAIVPIDPDLPAERIEFILSDTQMPWLIIQSSLQPKPPATAARILCLDQPLPTVPDNRSRQDADPRVKPENIAFVFYTSGSTGRPKGVMIPQAAYLSFVGPAIAFWQCTQADRILQFARFGFDVSIDQILTPLLAGATVVMRETDIWDPAKFTEVIRQHRLTMVHLPAAYWQKWVESLSPSVTGQPLGDLRLVQVGGDVMPVAAVRRWRELRIPGVRLINRYGPTETTMFSTAYEVPADSPSEADSSRIPIGRAVGLRTIHVLDTQLKPVPDGVTGEIYIGGETLARGYWNRPELSTERFIPDPFNPGQNARLYRTGDLGRWRDDGNLDFMGRADHQVKIRGYRMELGEIEVLLGDHPGVAGCAVVAQMKRDGDKVLIAHVVGRPGISVSGAALRQWLAEKLPDYMVPSQFVKHPSLPLNPNGKVDRKALSLIEPELAPAAEYIAPRTVREVKLTAIWQTVLKHERVGVRDNFFDLGGHSLLAVVICSKIKEDLDVEVPLRWIFEHPTIEAQAIQLLEQEAEIEHLLAEVEALEEADAGELLIRENNENHVVFTNIPAVSQTTFHCPDSPSAWFGRRRCNLIILINEDFEKESFERLAGLVREFDPLINVVVLPDQAGVQPRLPPGPTLTFSPAFVRHPQAARGKICSGYPMGKSDEFAALEKAGFRVPKWVVWSEKDTPDLSAFGEYVVQKPDHGGAGAEVKLVRKDEVSWKPISTAAAGASSAMIIQELIHTGPYPVCYRVNTLFGKALYCMKLETPNATAVPASSTGQPRLHDRASLVANEAGSLMSPVVDEEIIRLGEAAAQAFPNIPLLGFDILREVPSGKLFVLEANAIGYVWKFHSQQVAAYGYRVEEQFDGMRKAAYILADYTQQHAI